MLPDDSLSSDTATAYSLAIAFRLLETQQARSRAGALLAGLVARDGNWISTGPSAPADLRRIDRDRPRGHRVPIAGANRVPVLPWLYPVAMGATTIWERWDSPRLDGTLNPCGMSSFNHYALGAVADWLHRTVAGLAPHRPGYRRILFRPRSGGALTSASARHDTPYGTASIAWSLNEATLVVQARQRSRIAASSRPSR